MATEAERLYITLEARMDAYNRDLARAQALTHQKLGAMEARYQQMAARIKQSTADASAGLGTALGGVGLAIGAHAVLEYANEWTRLTRSLEGSEQAFGIVLKSGHEVTQLANEARIDVEAYAKTYVRAAAAVRDYGYTSNDAARVTSTLAKALKLGQASASEQASTILQFSQALQKGKLDGDEFRTVMENAGIVQEILAQKLKVSKGEIIEMAHQGKLNIKTLVSAMLEAQGKIDGLFKQMPLTVDEAFAVLRNNVVEYLGNADKMNGTTQALANGIQGIANHLDAVAVVAGALLGSASLRMAAFAAATTSAANPLTLLAAALGALTVAYDTFGSKVALSQDGVVTLGDAVTAFFDKMNARTELETLTMQIEMLTGAEKEAAIQQKDMLEKYSGFWGTMRLGADVVAHYAAALDDAAGGPAQRFLAAMGAIGDSVAHATGLMDDARRAALEAKAESVKFGFGGDGFKSYLQDTNRRPSRDIKPTNGQRSQFEREVDQIEKRTAALQAEVQTIGLSTLAQEKAKAMAELRFAAMQTAAKEGRKVSADEQASIEKLSTAYANAQAQAAFLNKLQAERENTQNLRDQVALVGLEGAALEKARIKQQLLNDARKAGIDLTPQMREQISALADQNAQYKHALDTISEIRTQSQDALKGFISDMREGTSASEALGNALNRIADKLIDMGANSLVETALGGLLGGNSGSGSILGGLLGLGGGGATTSGWATSVLPAFAGGGVTRGASLAGEAGPEAVVPLPDGRRIPVALSMPSIPKAVAPGNGPSLALTVAIDARGATQDSVAQMKNDLVPTIQKVVRNEVNQLFDRSARFAKTGI